MAEQFADFFRITAAAATGTAIVDAVAAQLVVGARWSTANSSSGKALLQCTLTGAEVVLHGAAAQIQVGYAPNGDIADWDGTPTASVFTGMRNITAAGNMTTITAAVDLALYEDALLVAVGSSVAGWRYAAMAGKCIEPVDDSDIAIAIGIDALLIGVPSAGTTAPSWTNGGAVANVGSCVRTGTVFAQVGSSPSFVANAPETVAGHARLLARINDVERMVPYAMFVIQPAGIGQFVGMTTYVRQWRASVPHGTRLFSDTVGSDQAWFGHQYDATPRNQFVLWSKA